MNNYIPCCCCNFTPATACVVWGCVFSVGSIVSLCNVLSSGEWLFVNGPLCAVGLIADFMLAIGGYKNQPNLAKPWVPVTLVIDVVTIISYILMYTRTVDTFILIPQWPEAQFDSQLYLIVFLTMVIGEITLICYVSWVIYRFVKNPGPYPRHGMVLATNETECSLPLEMSDTYTEHRENRHGRTFCHTKFLRPTN